MRAVIQKSGPAFVEIDGERVSEINSGYVILLGITQGDDDSDIEYLVKKIINLRLFSEGEKYFEKSLLETGKEALVISQFTLYADTKKGRRPDFAAAERSEIAKPLYQKFVRKMEEKGCRVRTGVFGATMNITLTNEGPITIILDSRPERA